MPDQRSLVSGRLRVLLVEDEALVADYVADILEEAGYEVAGFAATGENALQRLEQSSLDVAILDIKLKGNLSGIDVACRAQELSTPHVFISGSGDPSTRGRRCHAAACLSPEAIQLGQAHLCPWKCRKRQDGADARLRP